VYHIYALRHPKRDQILERLNKNGAQAGIHYPFPVHRLGAFQHLATRGSHLCESEAWAAECLSLPLYPELDQEKIAFVVSCL
jgi:dTDP-4-amino-4,6-dideoxygalactose transaminase